ncbi:MAG: YHYH protein, partial [Thermoproteota archaeon]|nr:YHYH protein [Thermoproteota archaeon]
MPTIEIDFTSINPVQVIKNITDFYISKGTKLATQYLFKILFGENVDLYYPKDEIISPSHATWVVDTILRAELISGDPSNLIDSEVNQYADEVDNNVKAASALIENVITIIEGTDTIYELAISEETLTGSFVIPYKTKLVEPLSTTGQIITVDSTIGWPERNGTIFLDDNETVQYKEKSLNQFIECTRSKNGVVEDWDPGTIIQSDIFVYVNKDTSEECKLRILGIAEAGTTVLDNTGSYYLKGDKLKVANLGSTAEDQRLSSWLYNVKKLISISEITPGGVNNQTATVVCGNPHGLLVEDTVTIYGANPVVYNGTFIVTARLDAFSFSYEIATPTEIIPQGNILLSVDLNRGKSNVTSINKVVSEFTTNIQNAFFNNDYVYVAASGLPNYKIGPFTGSALIPGNQRKLLRFPRNVQTISERQTVAPGTPIGTWINGVSIWSYKSKEYVQFGPLTSISVDEVGISYDAGAKPNVEITGGGGTGGAAEVVVNGSLDSFDVLTEGTGYIEAPLVSIVGGGGSGATAQAVITGGRVTRILVEQPGTGYTSQPSVSITGGGGNGATANANVRGPIQSVTITNFGAGYTSLPDVKVNSGENALAQPIVINGRIVSIAIINSGNSYTTAPNVIINGDGFGAIAKATIGTIGEDKGRVLGVTITNKGIGYTQGMTTVRLEAVGQLAKFTPSVYQWNRNLQYDLVDNYDVASGYVFTGYNNQFGGEYAHLSDPKELRYVVGDNVFLNPVTQEFQELASNYKHSPIIGWAFDGNPIYGPYGYIDPTDQNSGIRRMRTSYKLKTNVVYDAATNPNPARVDGPSLDTYPAGQFVADYYYDFQSGDLDNYNGRFCKTPEYPNGTYAYFITVDSSDAGVAEFPYIMGPQFNSLPDDWNFSQIATQENIPSGVVRYRDPFSEVDIDVERQPNQEADVLTTEIEGYPLIFEIQDSNNDGIIDADEQQEILQMSEEATLQIYDYFPSVSTESRVDIEVETTTQFENAKIDGFVVENPGESYQVDDTVFFDNEGTGGFGASALIESVKGQKIVGYSKEMIGDRPYGHITTSVGHELRQQDEIIVNSRPIIDNTSKTYKVKVVAGVESISVLQEGTGYQEAIPPTFEVITPQGQDAKLEIIREMTGQVKTVNIINSGNGYDEDNEPQIRVSHPQQYKKTRYWLSEYKEATGIIDIHHTLQSPDRYTYICGSITEADGDIAALIAKFDDLGQLIWERSLIPQNVGQKRLEFVKMHLDSSLENDMIYVTGQYYDPNNNTFNPDVWMGLYESGFNNVNAPDGILKWQKAIAGISGSTRRDYVTSICLDQDKNIYLGGYTDSNSPDPNDMWIVQCDLDGDLVEKRKIASADGSEELNQIQWISTDTFFFTGVNRENNDVIFGVFFYDGANLEISWIRQVPVASGYVRNPQFIIDEYEDVVLIWDIYNNGSAKYDTIQINKFPLATASTAWEWTKTVTVSGSPDSIRHAGITVDNFGNYTLVSDVIESENQRYAIVHYLKYDGSLIAESKIDDTVNIGFQAKSHSVDSSGDCIVAVNRQQSDQIASYRFNDALDLDYDMTKQNTATWSIYSPGDASIDTTYYKYGTSALKLSSICPIKLSGLALQTKEWSFQGWFSMATAQQSAANSKPLFFDLTPIAGDSIQVELDGDSGSANYQKWVVYVNSTEVATSTSATNWTSFASGAWCHVTFQKREESLGLYRYEVFLNGNQQITYQSTSDISLQDMTIAGKYSGPVSGNSFIGWIDDLLIDDDAPYATAAYTMPSAEIPITTSNSDVALIKFDREHTRRDSYTATGLTNYTNFAITDVSTTTTWVALSAGAITLWEAGPGGLQILDMSQAPATYIPATTALTQAEYQYGSKTSTIPSPSGKKLLITADVISKFYLRDALYQKIDNVMEFTFSQDIKLTKGSILQQFNDSGVTQAYGTIVKVPEGTLLNPGYGNKYQVGKIFGTFNNTDRYRTDVADVNQIAGTYFDTEEEESPWVAATVYAQGDQVYSDKKIYAAQGAGTSGTIAPTHTTGVVSDGSINWAFIDDAGKFTIDLTEHPHPRPQYLGMDMPEWVPGLLYVVGQQVWYKLNVYEVAAGGGGVAGTTAPVHTTGNASDGGVTWTHKSVSEAIGTYTRNLPYDQGNNYKVQIVSIHPGSTFIPEDVVSLNADNVTVAEDEKSVVISGFASVKKIRVTARLEKDIIRTAEARTE